MTLVTANGEVARRVIRELQSAALARLSAEMELSRSAIASGEEKDEQLLILQSWLDWYREALATATDIEVGGASPRTLAAIEDATARVTTAGQEYLAMFR
jgi:hypothetical protein